MVGSAKGNEEIFLPDRVDPVLLPRHSQGLFLIQRVRDEAHRFARRHHQERRRKDGLSSKLDEIPGIGPARRKALIQAFGSVEGVRNAPIDDLTEIRGITPEMAERLKAEI